MSVFYSNRLEIGVVAPNQELGNVFCKLVHCIFKSKTKMIDLAIGYAKWELEEKGMGTALIPYELIWKHLSTKDGVRSFDLSGPFVGELVSLDQTITLETDWCSADIWTWQRILEGLSKLAYLA